MATIFVQIASYRDPELQNTLDSLFNKAKYPDNLHVCVAHQHSPEDEWDKVQQDVKNGRVTILDIEHTKSLGACWARHEIQKQYKGEDFTLQLDSHHRFVKNWDVKLIKMYNKLKKEGHDKPLITSYIPSYDPQNDPKGRVKQPWAMRFDRFTPEGVVFFMPYTPKDISKPIPARFYSAHFTFASGSHVKEVPHDPTFYFHGEEISLAVRSFTHGYDLFHPNEVIAWHEYTRVGRTKQWDDDKEWVKRNEFTHARVRQLLGVDGEVCTPCNEKHFGDYGLGKVRSLKDYEKYAGIRFSNRSITMSCKNDLPPGSDLDEEYFESFRHPIKLLQGYFPDNDHEFCAVIAEVNGQQVFRQDLNKQQIMNVKQFGDQDHWIEYQGPKPTHIIIWPFSNTSQWYNKQVLNI